MAVVATNPPTFPLFSSLAPELRNQVWKDALPEKVGPALYFYKKGCWCPRRLSENDEGHDPENDENNLNLEFRHDLIEDAHLHIEIPLFFVNREARSIALAWMREQGVNIRFRKETQHPIFVRPLNPKSDALYIADGGWSDFLAEPKGQESHPDLFEQSWGAKSDITCLAVPEALSRVMLATLYTVFEYLGDLNLLLIVRGAQPEVRYSDDSMQVQQHWQFESIKRGVSPWNDDRGDLASEENKGEDVGEKDFWGLIEWFNKMLREGFAEDLLSSFEVRPVRLVRRLGVPPALS